MRNTYVIIKKDCLIRNLKCHDLLNIYFKNEYSVLYLSYDETIKFIYENNKENIKIIYYTFNSIDNYDLDLINFIKNTDILSNIYFFLEDWWKIPDSHQVIQNSLMDTIYNATNYKVITGINNIEQLNSYYNKDYTIYKKNILPFNCWSSYKSSFIDFNENPIEKVFLSGHTNICYPEREILRNKNNVFYYTYNTNDIHTFNNNYNKELNKYIACFTSSVHIYNETEQKFKNTNIILLKTFEILASGSLLLMPLNEEIYLEKIGIKNGYNCILLDFDKCLNEQISLILDINNRTNINVIRQNGYLHAKNNLTTDKKFNEFNLLLQ